MSSSPIGLAPGQLTRLNRVAPEAGDGPPAGLLDALGRVPDPRDPRGIRYGLAAVLGVAVCATLAGARSYAAIGEWAADAPVRVRAGLGLRPGAVPDPATIWRILTAVDPAGLDAAICAWVRSRLAASPKARRRVVLAVDGKTLRGARPRGGTAPHLMACLDHAAGAVIAQIAVDGKTNEITMLEALLDQVSDLGDALVTMDALHAQREHAACLHKRGAHYLVTIKGNQPGLLRQLRSLPWKDVPPGHVSAGRAHGRAEKRTVKVVTVAAGLGFPHAARAIQVTRKTRRNGSPRWTTETSYAITSLLASKARPDQLAEWIRGHWKIENQLHWVRSPGVLSLSHVVAPDACQIRFAARLGRCGARHRRCSEDRPVKTCHVRNTSPGDNECLIMVLPARFAEMPYMHQISPLENIRDVTYGEDLSPARTGTGPHVMAALRNLAISILRLAGHASIATALRTNARDPARPYHLVKGHK